MTKTKLDNDQAVSSGYRDDRRRRGIEIIAPMLLEGILNILLVQELLEVITSKIKEAT